MTPAFIFLLMCLEKIGQAATTEFFPSVNWKNKFIVVKPGQNLTLPCLYREKFNTRISWFQQTLEKKPTIICVYRISSGNLAFYHHFENNPRFKLHPHSKGANLTITNLRFSDSATYYCANQDFYVCEFTVGYTVIVEGSELSVNQSPSDSFQSGGSGTLNCTVHTGICDRNHTIYWFRNSKKSELKLAYSHQGRNNQCEKKTNTCFYSLSIKRLNISQTGTYYCAVKACGHILFGNGTKLEFEDKGNLFVWVFYLSAAWIFTIIVVVVLLSIYIFLTKKRNGPYLSDSQSSFPVAFTANTERNQEEHNLHYAAVRANQLSRSRIQRNGHNECVYSGVRQ